jgi:hypothetical protein
MSARRLGVVGRWWAPVGAREVDFVCFLGVLFWLVSLDDGVVCSDVVWNYMYLIWVCEEHMLAGGELEWGTEITNDDTHVGTDFRLRPLFNADTQNTEVHTPPPLSFLLALSAYPSRVWGP